MSGSRYLSKIEKAVELLEWHDKSSSPGVAPGDPDEAIILWCKLINHIPGICTLQSCTGHRRANGYVMALTDKAAVAQAQDLFAV